MHTDSSAIATCLRLRSTVECTATVRMPRAWHARRMRSAISPRLAITTLSSWLRTAMPAASADHEQRLVALHRLAALDQDLEHGAGDVGLDRVEQLHRLDDGKGVAGLDRLADGHERRLVRCRRGVEGADHGRAHDVPVGQLFGR